MPYLTVEAEIGADIDCWSPESRAPLEGVTTIDGLLGRQAESDLITSFRAMSLWPNKGDADTRPPLGSGYERVRAVMPHRPAVPAGAHWSFPVRSTRVSNGLHGVVRTRRSPHDDFH